MRSVYLCLQGRLTGRQQALHAQLFPATQLCSAAPERVQQALCAIVVRLHCTERVDSSLSMLNRVMKSSEHTKFWWSPVLDMHGDVLAATAAPIDGRVFDVLHALPSTLILWGKIISDTAVVNGSCFLCAGFLDWQGSFNHKQMHVSGGSVQ